MDKKFSTNFDNYITLKNILKNCRKELKFILFVSSIIFLFPITYLFTAEKLYEGKIRIENKNDIDFYDSYFAKNLSIPRCNNDVILEVLDFWKTSNDYALNGVLGVFQEEDTLKKIHAFYNSQLSSSINYQPQDFNSFKKRFNFKIDKEKFNFVDIYYYDNNTKDLENLLNFLYKKILSEKVIDYKIDFVNSRIEKISRYEEVSFDNLNNINIELSSVQKQFKDKFDGVIKLNEKFVYSTNKESFNNLENNDIKYTYNLILKDSEGLKIFDNLKVNLLNDFQIYNKKVNKLYTKKICTLTNIAALKEQKFFMKDLLKNDIDKEIFFKFNSPQILKSVKPNRYKIIIAGFLGSLSLGTIISLNKNYVFNGFFKKSKNDK